MKNEVFQRDEFDSFGVELGPRVYNLVIGFVLGWGFYVNYYIITNIPVSRFESIHPLLLMFLFFAFIIAGTLYNGPGKLDQISVANKVHLL